MPPTITDDTPSPAPVVHLPTVRYSATVESERRVLMLIPSYVEKDDGDSSQDRRPTMDYQALQRALNADLADYASVDRDQRIWVRLARFMGKDVALAVIGFLQRRQYDVIYSNGENVSIPLAASFFGRHRKVKHVLIGHHLSTPKKRILLKVLHRHMDCILLYAKTQLEYAVQILGIPASKLRLIPFQVDHRFFREMRVPETVDVCSAGLEWRDYPTLIEAVRGLPVQVKLAAASPWSKHKNETQGQQLPENVDVRRYSYNELRTLYAESRIVVVPLYENDFQAGITTILEGMAMGKPVVVTRTTGQTDVIEGGYNGIYVAPSNIDGLRAITQHLLDDEAVRQRLGSAARRTIEESMTLDHWVDRIVEVISSV